MGTFNVSLKTLTDRVSMEVVYTPKELDQICVEIAEVNRPGLFLAGYYDYFDKLRLQIMGLAEMNFLSGLSAEKRYEALDQLFRQQPPAVIVCRSEELTPFPEMQELAQKHGVALLRSNETTCTLMGSLISVLNLELAPRITRHGVLVEVYGEGILILGDSGIGKSELAIELVKRGHRLVADDASGPCCSAGDMGPHQKLPAHRSGKRVLRYSGRQHSQHQHSGLAGPQSGCRAGNCRHQQPPEEDGLQCSA